MRVIYEALRTAKTTGKATPSGDALLAAMIGQIFESPRGQIFIDAQTRDVVQSIYIRRVERVGDQLWNQEIETVTDVKDIGKSR
jgi:branched-chain amino acid transport system substrate-binding protein